MGQDCWQVLTYALYDIFGKCYPGRLSIWSGCLDRLSGPVFRADLNGHCPAHGSIGLLPLAEFQEKSLTAWCALI